jgi:hypothetical protein
MHIRPNLDAHRRVKQRVRKKGSLVWENSHDHCELMTRLLLRIRNESGNGYEASLSDVLHCSKSEGRNEKLMKPFHRWGALLFTFSVVISALAQAGTPRLIDVHMHYNGEPGVLEKLLVKLNAVDGMAILLTTPQGLPEATRFIREHPDRFVGFGDVKLDTRMSWMRSTDFIRQAFVA